MLMMIIVSFGIPVCGAIVCMLANKKIEIADKYIRDYEAGADDLTL